MKTVIILIFVVTLLCQLESTKGHKKINQNVTEAVTGNDTDPQEVNSLMDNNNITEISNSNSTKLVRSKRQARVIVERGRPRKLARRRPPFPPHRRPPISRRRFPKRGKGKFHSKPPKIGPHSQFGPPVGFFVMNINNEIVHKSKDLGDIPPQYLDKIIPPNFISDSPQKIYALEHNDQAPPLGLGESQELSNWPTNSYGHPVQTQQFDPQQYYPYPPVPTIESNNIPQSTETRTQTHPNQINNYNRGQSETQQHHQELPPVVYHPPYKKNKKKKKKLQAPSRQEPALPLEPTKNYNNNNNNYPVSSYDAPLSFVPSQGAAPAAPSNENRYQPPRVRPVFNVGQSFVESYSRDSSEQEPPPLPANYNQNDFKTVNKSNNKKKVIYQVNTSYEDIDDGDTDHGLALEYPPSSEEEITDAPPYNFGVRNKKKKKPSQFDFIDSYEDSSISQEVYRTTPYTIPRAHKKSPLTTKTTQQTYRIRSSTRDPLIDILDTEDLRNAFQSGRHRYKLHLANKNKEPQNFVLLSSKNPPTFPRATSKIPFIINSGEDDFKSTKTKSANSYERPSSDETDYESYEIAERDFGLRKREFTHKKKGGAIQRARKDTSVETIKYSDAKRPDDFVPATTMKPRFNPDVHFTKTFSSKIEQQPRESSFWNGQTIPGNHKIAKKIGVQD